MRKWQSLKKFMMLMLLSMVIPLSALAKTPTCETQLFEAEFALVKCSDAASLLYGQATELDAALRATLDQNTQLAEQLEAEQNPPFYMRKELWFVTGLVLGFAVTK